MLQICNISAPADARTAAPVAGATRHHQRHRWARNLRRVRAHRPSLSTSLCATVHDFYGPGGARFCLRCSWAPCGAHPQPQPTAQAAGSNVYRRPKSTCGRAAGCEWATQFYGCRVGGELKNKTVYMHVCVLFLLNLPIAGSVGGKKDRVPVLRLRVVQLVAQRVVAQTRPAPRTLKRSWPPHLPNNSTPVASR